MKYIKSLIFINFLFALSLFAAPNKIDICHWDETAQAYQKLNVSTQGWVNGHQPHHPKDLPAGTGGLDANCKEIVITPTVYARFYSDINQSSQFDAGDHLYAEIVADPSAPNDPVGAGTLIKFYNLPYADSSTNTVGETSALRNQYVLTSAAVVTHNPGIEYSIVDGANSFRFDSGGFYEDKGGIEKTTIIFGLNVVNDFICSKSISLPDTSIFPASDFMNPSTSRCSVPWVRTASNDLPNTLKIDVYN